MAPDSVMGAEPFPVQHVRIHGHRRAFVMTGSGPVLLLLHGVGMNHRTWLPVLPDLARHFTVIAPDLLGHGESDKPRADYSIGGYANGMRDLLVYLGVESVTVVGQSLGGGIAMQFAYQYPAMTERIVLVASGGLGRSVNPMIRALTIPGSGLALAAVTRPPVRRVAIPLLVKLSGSGLPWTSDLHGLAEVYDALADVHAQAAFLHVLRAAVDWRGQVIGMIDRAYLARWMPSLVVWGDRDLVIPVKHAYSAHELFPGSRLEIFPGAGHMPHEDDPTRFVELLTDFVSESAPATYDPDVYRSLLRSGHDPRHQQRVIDLRTPNAPGREPQMRRV